MTEIMRDCPLCGSRERASFFKGKIKGCQVIYVLCNSCGLVYQSPAPSQEELDQYYEREYRLQYQGSEGPTAKDLEAQKGRAGSLSRFAANWVGRVSTHLDIGCSAGILLQEFNAKLGTRPVGIEPGAAYREYAQQQGLKVYASLDELKAVGGGSFDLVSMAHVLEHLPDPVRYLNDLREYILSPQGYLLIEVPNLYAHDSFEPAHLAAFSAHTLKETVKKAGYKVKTLKAHGRPRSRWIPLYLTLVAVPQIGEQGAPVKPEHGVAFKRRSGFLRRRLLEKLMLPGTWMN